MNHISLWLNNIFCYIKLFKLPLDLPESPTNLVLASIVNNFFKSGKTRVLQLLESESNFNVHCK